MAERAGALELTEQHGTAADGLAEIIEGLGRRQKALSPKFFYDERGSKLFERITEQPEYYPTDTERAIMQDHIGEIAACLGAQASLIEFGSGSSLKTRLLLRHMIDPAVYVPVDISRDHLLAAAGAMAAEFPGIEVLPVAADFTQPFELPDPAVMPVRNIVYFPGSTIGNFTPADADSLLRVMYQEAGEGGALLIGVDLQKDKSVLEAAYNDRAGITAEFNRNLLHRLNGEFGADFDSDAFEHLAFYDEDHGRIEMHLRSLAEQTVTVGGRTFSFAAGETLHTENSYKYTLAGFRQIADRAGFDVDTVWTDARGYFSVQYCVRR